jgi:hypothetical protein
MIVVSLDKKIVMIKRIFYQNIFTGTCFETYHDSQDPVMPTFVFNLKVAERYVQTKCNQIFR